MASRQSPDIPKRLELSFAGVDLPDRLPELLAWLRAPRGLAQQALVASNADFSCWADFRGTCLQDSDAAELLGCLGNLRVARLWLASNSLTQKSAGRLRDFVQRAEGLRDLDLACNDLDDEAVFGLISALATRKRYQRWLYLAGNQVRNPPALLERLRRAGVHVCLDEASSDLPSDGDHICLPYFCFQSPDTVDRDPGLEKPGEAKQIHTELEEERAVPSLSAKASKDVTSALRTLRTIIPPSDPEQTPLLPQTLPQTVQPEALPQSVPLADAIFPIPALSQFGQVNGFHMAPEPFFLGQAMSTTTPTPLMNPLMTPLQVPALNGMPPPPPPVPPLNTTCATPRTPPLPLDLFTDLHAGGLAGLTSGSIAPTLVNMPGAFTSPAMATAPNGCHPAPGDLAMAFGAVDAESGRTEVGEAPWKSQRRRARKPGVS